MTVIVWDGRSLAADRLMTCGSQAREARKLFVHERGTDGRLFAIAICGTLPGGLLLRDWYLAGADPEKFPAAQATDDGGWLIVWDPHSTPELVEYARLPVAMPVIDPRESWGSGADFALGAMAMGADARRAAEVACELCVHCGKGIDVVTREELGA